MYHRKMYCSPFLVRRVTPERGSAAIRRGSRVFSRPSCYAGAGNRGDTPRLAGASLAARYRGKIVFLCDSFHGLDLVTGAGACRFRSVLDFDRPAVEVVGTMAYRIVPGEMHMCRKNRDPVDENAWLGRLLDEWPVPVGQREAHLGGK